ncbi:phenylacetic acid degradation operon negative regulatory protein PaaX [Roseomonas marmotae]|uniref:Phenylacetic acid degradation operon negative regulatory protein PaaX n=1 Tax=Roseomonas marmotae TaxID=2768161 RepID=A0ABS3K9J2_9PROT|nr:phenylacetic acid degradation operon negative regulatory protein PaaX [Roseomonas marmotae]MBO1074115.1 phenylacetic acid degradation operon negative regulatory protein PaaX [Roseomonas marmotae]QTI78897.1 phenylacetic acid degradation operon negative regulatory protein PaaX [Roseomonas marmotae]
MTAAPLLEILHHLNSAPSRTWSVVITVFGDAIVPRGGAVSLATLTEIFQAMGVAEGAVRTAMSRLSADGWLERSRQGRNSFYALAGKGQATFAEAAGRIYAPHAPAAPGRFRLVLAEGAEMRAALQQAGFGMAQPGLWVAPEGVEVPPEAAAAITLLAEADTQDARRLAGQCWPLEALAEAYRRFVAAFEPLALWMEQGHALEGVDALVARVLLIHEYRRAVLRHPPLPRALLPADWAGDTARALCGQLYRALLPASEAWLEEHATRAEGPLPPPGPDLAARFRER